MIFDRHLVLASRSPRRYALLKQIGISVEVISSTVEEVIRADRSPEENAVTLALMKAEEVAARCNRSLVLAADTIVELEGRMLGKPANRSEAISMLTLLSGQTHSVHTGFAVIDKIHQRKETGIETTRVTFREIPLDEIESYVDGGSPMDKAGAYGIQDDYGAVFVTRIEGCYYNVMGLPLARVFSILRTLESRPEAIRETQ